jgi:hypothetical protein
MNVLIIIIVIAFVIVAIGTCSIEKSSKLKFLFLKLETRFFGHAQKHRAIFIFIGAVFVVLGVVINIFVTEQKLSRTISAITWGLGSSLSLMGFVFTIYSIASFLQRPRSIFEILAFLEESIREVQKTGFLIMICEYPAVGALSEEKSYAFERYRKVLEECKPPITTDNPQDKCLYICSIIPEVEKMNNKLKKVATATSLSSRLESAQEINERFVEILTYYQAHGHGRIIHPHGELPSYQLFITGEIINKDSIKEAKLIPHRAILFLALEEREINTSTAKGNNVREVPIMAWNIISSSELSKLMSLALEIGSVNSETALFTTN